MDGARNRQATCEKGRVAGCTQVDRLPLGCKAGLEPVKACTGHPHRARFAGDPCQWRGVCKGGDRDSGKAKARGMRARTAPATAQCGKGQGPTNPAGIKNDRLTASQAKGHRWRKAPQHASAHQSPGNRPIPRVWDRARAVMPKRRACAGSCGRARWRSMIRSFWLVAR